MLSSTALHPTTTTTLKPHPNPISTATISRSFLLPIKSKPLSRTPRVCCSITTTTPSPSLKSRLAAGDTLYGLFLLSSSPTLAEIAGLSGYDFVVVDMEHGPGGISSALPCLRALSSTSTPSILRLPDPSPLWAKKALDLGPNGLMFPSVDSPAAARLAISSCRFPPRGIRGSAHTVVRASSYGIDEGYLQTYEDDLLIMVQVETAEAVRNVEEIAAVDGVDCVQMGPLDLSASLGYLWEPGHRKVREVLRDVERRMLEGGGKGKAWLGGFAMPHDPPSELKRRGYHMVSGAVDLGMFRKAAVEDVEAFWEAPREGNEEEKAEGDGEGDGYFIVCIPDPSYGAPISLLDRPDSKL